MVMQLRDGLLQMHVDSLFADTQFCRNLLIFQMLLKPQQEHLPGLCRQLRVHIVSKIRIALCLAGFGDIEAIVYGEKSLYSLAHLPMGKDVHATVADGTDQIPLSNACLRKVIHLQQSGKDITDDILALLAIMQQPVGHQPQPGIILVKQLLYLYLLLHLFYITAEGRKVYTKKR